MKKIITPLLLSVVVCCGCNDQKSSATETKKEDQGTEKTTGKDDDSNSPATAKKAEYLSDVDITETGGLKVTRAFVSSVAGDVFTGEVTAWANEKRILNLSMEGFKVVDGRSYVGIAEKITSSEGTEVLDVADLFEQYTSTGISEDDAHHLRLSATLTEGLNSPYYTVSFRIWDKKGEGVVTGSYRIKTALPTK